MLCLTGCEKRLEKTVGRIERHRNFMHEVRIDLLDGIPHSFSRLNEYDGLLLTLRSVNQGGGFTGSDDDRNSILRKIAEETKALIDVEYRPDGDARSLFDGDVLRRTVLSFHDFSGVPARLEEIAREMDSSGAGLLKIAVKCEDTSDLLRLFNLKAFLRRPALLIGMGIHGRLSRFLYKRFGSPFTFAVEDENAFGGAGLLTLKEIRDFGLGRNSELEPLGVIGGDHVVNSSGVKVYNRLFRDKGLDFIYLPLPAKDFDGALELAEKLGFQGLSVTMPHKEAALKKCAEASVQAEKTGAVNTLARRNHGWYGENTDINGLKLAMRDIAVHEGLRAAVFGCGGAARAAVYLMTKAGADVTVFHRDSIKA
ncbi:MAG: type I 3-dehydroquinate dehydratase, partial [Deltaproteobacteria bacterium]|nr:type I 3-dehydroquinate dehydratase [Deltaproteobacteria bacterium]